ncbi:hypothetical protein JCM17960_04490 [Magnetospira thiophila]
MKRLGLALVAALILDGPAQAQRPSNYWQALCQTDPTPCIGVVEGFLQGLDKGLRRMDGYDRLLLRARDGKTLEAWPPDSRIQARRQLLACLHDDTSAEILVPIWMAYLVRRPEEAGDPVGKTLPAAIRDRFTCP